MAIAPNKTANHNANHRSKWKPAIVGQAREKMQTCAKRGKNNATSGAKRGKIRLSEVVTIGCGYVWFWLVEGNEITVLFD